MKKIVLNVVLLVSILGLTCQAPTQKRNGGLQPTIRIGIIEEKPAVEFEIHGKANFVNADGSFKLANTESGRWRVEVIHSKPADITYQLVIGTERDRYAAEDIANSARRKGLNAYVKKIERKEAIILPYFRNSVYQVVLTDKFKTETEAKLYQNKIEEITNSDLIRVPNGEPQGVLQFTNLDNQSHFDSRTPIRLIASDVGILNVDVGTGYHWEGKEDRRYGGEIEFLLDASAQVTVVNELPLESYLKGVVPSEMPSGFPYEALKAQAVAARVEAISKIGLRHPNAPFDLCDDVHCQVFSGLSKQAESTNMAVESTRGIFIIYRGKITEAFYAGVCGGHTENNENVWLMDAKSYLRGILDSKARRLSTSLQDERNVRKWIDSSPDVFCNTTRGSVPSSLNYSKKYFRWQVEYGRSELEEIIRNKTGEYFGNLMDLIPIKRGVSGRLIELEVVGTQKRFVLSRELPIRQALSKRTLYSSCFYVQKQGGTRSLPQKFILRGAGWGHGVGMCQIGAAMMAQSGKKFDQILTHYYQGVFLEKLYN